MKKLIISGLFCSVLVLGGFQVASAQQMTTEAGSNPAMLAKIQDLMKLIADLQAKLTKVQGEVRELTKDLSIGASDEDVKKAQEILASDPVIFGVQPTGYFGPLTETAMKRFQERYNLPVTGILDEATREVMKELRAERKDGVVPPGLIVSEEVKDRVKARLQAKWGDCDFTKPFRASLCEKVKDKKDKDDDDSEDEEDEDKKVTRDDARRAVVDAQNALNTFRDDIEEMEDDDASEDELDEANDILAEAQKEMKDARKAFYKQDFDKALDAAEEVIDIIEDEDEDDDLDYEAGIDDTYDEDDDDGVTEINPQNTYPVKPKSNS